MSHGWTQGAKLGKRGPGSIGGHLAVDREHEILITNPPTICSECSVNTMYIFFVHIKKNYETKCFMHLFLLC
jgi:hypothetical protein